MHILRQGLTSGPMGYSRLLLFNNGESEEEGTRNVVAECLGRFTLLNPALYLAELQAREQAAEAGWAGGA